MSANFQVSTMYNIQGLHLQFASVDVSSWMIISEPTAEPLENVEKENRPIYEVYEPTALQIAAATARIRSRGFVSRASGLFVPPWSAPDYIRRRQIAPRKKSSMAQVPGKNMIGVFMNR